MSVEPSGLMGRWQDVKREICYLANLITFGRLLASPAVGWLVVVGSPAAAPVFLAAWFSDVLDGWVAAIQGTSEGKLGQWFDPLADKVLLVAVFISVWQSEIGWLVLGPIVLELGQFAGYCLFVWRYPRAEALFMQHANGFGKAKTFTAGALTLALLTVGLPLALAQTGIGVVTGLALLSVVGYLRGINWPRVKIECGRVR